MHERLVMLESRVMKEQDSLARKSGVVNNSSLNQDWLFRLDSTHLIWLLDLVVNRDHQEYIFYRKYPESIFCQGGHRRATCFVLLGNHQDINVQLPWCC